MQEVVAGRYELGRELGRGGMSRVVEGRDLRLDRRVAVKLLPDVDIAPSNEVARRRFVREARSAASFSHPHAVAVFDAGDADGVLYLVMELVHGESLASKLAREGPLDVDEALDLTDQVLQALGAAHRAGIVHRDVKPGNVLVTAGGAAKLADFGIAKRFDDVAADVTSTGQFVGTPSYLAPEQLAGAPATPAGDLYSTGVLLFEMLAGEPPFVATSPIATALAHRDAPIPDVRSRRADISAPVAAVVVTAMAKDPAARFDDADTMRAALRPTDGATMVGGPLPDPMAPATTPAAPTTALPIVDRRRNRTWWWIAAALAVAVTATVIAFGREDGDGTQLGSTSTTVVATPVGSPAPAPVTTAAPVAVVPAVASTIAPVPSTTPPVQLAAADVDELIVLVRDQPAAFGERAEDLGDDLERIAERREGNSGSNRIDRLLSQVDEWTADGTMTQGAADLVRAVLTDLAAETTNDEGGDDGGGDEGEDDD